MPYSYKLKRKKTALNINFLTPSKQLQAVAIYMIGIGAIVFIWPFVTSVTNISDSSSLSFWQTAKFYAREISLALGFIVGGIALLKKQLWSRKLCLTVLGLAFFYGGNKVAWLWVPGAASTTVSISAYALSFLFFGIAFIILFLQLTAENLQAN